MKYSRNGLLYTAKVMSVADIETDVFSPENMDEYQLLINSGIDSDKIDTDAVATIKWNEVTTRRNNLLLTVDWTQANDSPLTDEQKSAFAAYRQALRDIPQTYDDPDAVEWPQKPTV